MNSPTFKNLSRVLEKWPVDHLKKGRDFGEYLRQHVGKSFGGPQSQIDFDSWDQIVLILSRLTSNHYKTTYPVTKYVSSTGLTGSDCSKAMSNEFMEYLNEEDQKKGVKKLFQFRLK